MIRHMQAYLASSDKGGVSHPCGDGFRRFLVLGSPDSPEVTAVYVPTLETVTVSRTAWMALRPLDVELTASSMLARVTRSAEALKRCGLSFDRDVFDQIVFALRALSAPPARVRVRAS